MGPRSDRVGGVDGTAQVVSVLTGDEFLMATKRLEVVARDGLAMAANELAGIATSARPAVQSQLLDVIADLDGFVTELRHIIVALRSGHDV